MAFDTSGALQGTGTGAASGAALGSVVPGIGTAIGGGIGGILGGIGGGLLARQPQETKIQTKQRELVDQLLASLNGNGPYSGLFQADEAAFQKSYVDPAKATFRNQIAPQIQQAFVGGQYGQQRGGTNIEDQLARAGVDLDQMLNQQYANFQQQAMNRQQDAIGKILGQGPGVATPQSMGSQALAGLGGYLSQPGFQTDISNILSSFNKQPQQQQRAGFEAEPITGAV